MLIVFIIYISNLFFIHLISSDHLIFKNIGSAGLTLKPYGLPGTSL